MQAGQVSRKGLLRVSRSICFTVDVLYFGKAEKLAVHKFSQEILLTLSLILEIIVHKASIPKLRSDKNSNQNVELAKMT